MKILVIGATGMIGTRIVAEALGRGHQITAASRTGQAEARPTAPTLTAVTLDASTPSAVAEHAAGHDAVISAISPPRDGSDPTPALMNTYRSLPTASCSPTSAPRRPTSTGRTSHPPPRSRLAPAPAPSAPAPTSCSPRPTAPASSAQRTTLSPWSTSSTATTPSAAA